MMGTEIKFYSWRIRLARLLGRMGWGEAEIWAYTGHLRELYFEQGYSPADALAEDRTCWEG
jgi:hypothetical protein